MITRLLVGFLVAVFVLEAVAGHVRRDRLRERVAADRAKFYRNMIATRWAITAIVVAIVLAEGDVTAANMGLAFSGEGYWGMSREVALPLAWGLTAYMVVMLVIGTFRSRARLRAGKPIPGRAEISMIIPRTPVERRLAAGVSVTAGVTEEILFRGLLIAAGTELFRLSPPLAGAIALIFFTAVHSYQGKRGMLGAFVVGFVYTVLYLFSGSLLPGILAHTAQDLLALLAIPADPSPRPAEANPQTKAADETEPADAGSPAEIRQAAEIGQLTESAAPLIPAIRSAIPE